MKKAITKFFKTFITLLIIEGFLFFLMVGSMMTDEPINQFGRIIFFIIRNILGFPLVLFNSDFPFFLNSQELPNNFIPLITLNLIFHTFLIRLLIVGFKNIRASKT